MKLEPSAIQLRFVPLDHMLLHEEDDPYRVKRLVLTLKREGKLRHPPLVAEQAGQYIVLDGATRITALREMGYRDVLVQLVDYHSEAVQVSAWHHVIAGLSHHRLLATLADVEAITLQPADAETAWRMLSTREIIAALVMRNGQWFAVLGEGDNIQRANTLCQLVAEYRGKAEVHRAVELDIALLIREYADLTAVMAFPTFSPDEICQIAFSGAKLPIPVHAEQPHRHDPQTARNRRIHGPCAGARRRGLRRVVRRFRHRG